MHEYLRQAAAAGVAVLLISEDLDEVLTLADRIAVMYEGAIVGEVDARAATVDELGLLMAGIRATDEPAAGSDRAAAPQRRWLMVAVPLGSLVVAHRRDRDPARRHRPLAR